MDVVYGAEEKLSQAIVESYERYSPKLIMVITTCTTDLIGDDIGSAVEKTKEQVGCDVIYSTGDFVGKSRPVGIQDSLYAMADQLICREDVARREGSVNLINSPTQRNAKKLQEMADLLTQMGIKINKICFDHTTTKDMIDLARADLNITGYRMSWAELMKKRMDVEYCQITGWHRYNQKKDPETISPYGLAGSTRVLKEIAKIMGKEGEAESVIEKNRTAVQLKECELYGQTVIEYASNSQAADRFRILARSILENGSTVVPKPLSRENLAIMAQKIREESRKKAGTSAAA